LGSGHQFEGIHAMSVSDEDAQARAEFEEMVRTAARDNRVTGLKYSLQQARSGAYALFGAGLVFLAFGLACFFSATLAAFDSLRIEHARIAAAIVYFVATGTMFVLFFWARRDRLWPSVAGLALYGCLLAPTAVMMSN